VSKHTATVSLGIMAAGFVGTLFLDSSATWVRFAQSGFEAGLVGGLADWFAVTALFRHPLGIPIPHTALLPKNRDKVSKAFISTVQDDLLSKKSIMDKLSQIPLVLRMLKGAEQQLQSDGAKAGIASLCEYIIMQIPLEKAAQFGEREIRTLVESLDTRSLLGKALEQAYDRKYDEKTFDFVLDMAERIVMKEEIRDRMGLMAVQALTHMNAGGFMQFAMNAFVGYFNEDRLGSLIQQFILNGIEGLRMKENPNRKAVLSSLRLWLDNPDNRNGIAAELDGWKMQLLSQWNVQDKLLELLQRLQHKALEWVRAESFAADYAIPFISRIVGKIESDTELLNKLELALREQIARWIETNHHKIGTLIQENIDRFDDKTLIALMEDKVGKDLQWIRVNGAICGFLIGIALAAVKGLIG